MSLSALFNVAIDLVLRRPCWLEDEPAPDRAPCAGTQLAVSHVSLTIVAALGCAGDEPSMTNHSWDGRFQANFFCHTVDGDSAVAF
jgi:hypothetical protein